MSAAENPDTVRNSDSTTDPSTDAAPPAALSSKQLSVGPCVTGWYRGCENADRHVAVLDDVDVHDVVGARSRSRLDLWLARKIDGNSLHPFERHPLHIGVGPVRLSVRDLVDDPSAH